MMFVYYNDVGDILYTTSAPVDGADGDYIEIEGDQIDLSHKVVVDGALQPRPGWQAAALREAREAASLSKTRLIGAIIEGQLLPENEIRQMMRGDIPDSLQPALDGMDPQARLHAENAWHN
ncbi:hypothetical protein, partial [Paracoccus sp. (in: a-proteobacteria)]|uniref:hypothetical protein n=1 Tax=Paracoccus sp. TaxID=267 RepID=UPI0026DF2B6D